MGIGWTEKENEVKKCDGGDGLREVRMVAAKPQRDPKVGKAG